MGEQVKKPHISVGLLAHVDAGKTTLSEGLLYCSGARLHRSSYYPTYIRRKRHPDTQHTRSALDTYGTAGQAGARLRI